MIYLKQCISLFTIAMLLFIILLMFEVMPKSTANIKYAGTEFLSPIDGSIHPCDDFYAFACNQWIKENPLPNGQDEWTVTLQTVQRRELVIKSILDRSVASFKSKAEIKAKWFYESCMDEGTLEKLGSQPLRKLITQIGGWNISPSRFNVSNWSFSKIMKIIHSKYNQGSLFNWAVGVDPLNSTRRLIRIDQGGLTFGDRESYNEADTDLLSAYLNHMTRIAKLLGGNERNARVQMQAVINFEIKLAKISAPPEEREDLEKLCHVMTVKELQELAPFINWRDHFRDAFRLVKRKITNKDVVLVLAPEYLKKLSKIINEYNASDNGKIILNNYFMWQGIISKFISHLSKDFQDAFDELKGLIFSYGEQERGLLCVAETESAFSFAVSTMYIREVVHGEERTQAEKIVNEVRGAVQQNVRNLEWMDEDTKRLAIEKVAAMTNMINYPDFILNDTQLDENYKELDIDPATFFENKIRIQMYNLQRNLETLNRPVNRNDWEVISLDEYAREYATYSYDTNTIFVSARMLQQPYFDVNNLRSLNFGAVGHVIGHEITHSLDNNGRKFDKFGSMRQWWNNKTIERFKNLTDCFVGQYEKYEIDGMTLNGKQTLNENIADNAGLRAAYNAFNKLKNKSDADLLSLFGTNMTQGQLFFLTFAQKWCAVYTDEAVAHHIETDSHSPHKFRVIGPLSNLPEFSKEFHCTIGSPMNPMKKCSIL